MAHKLLKAMVLTLLVAASATALASVAIQSQRINNDETTAVISSTTTTTKDPETQIRQSRIAYAATKGCQNPEQMVAAVEGSPFADLLLATAIEESKCDPNAVGDAGEEGAFQVIAKDWGPVPKDLKGQVKQAEDIIGFLLSKARRNEHKAMSRYNGGPTPGGPSKRYADRVISKKNELVALAAKKPEEGDI